MTHDDPHEPPANSSGPLGRPGSPRKLRVLFISMPWADLEMPSLALSTIAPLARASAAVERVGLRYANLEWADLVLEKTAGKIGTTEYSRLARGSVTGAGEWVFSSCVYPPRPARETLYYRWAQRSGIDLAAEAEMYDMAPAFVDAIAREIVGARWDVVALTSTFDQTMPSLALARAVKALDPTIVTVMGGANCEDTQGAALHRNFRFIDHVVRGEAEPVLPDLLDALASSGGGAAAPAAPQESPFARVSGLCWRNALSESIANPLAAQPVPADAIPEADFQDYFDAFWRSRVSRHVVPKVVVEAGRGCWWGEKHHCTFCGLNGSTMAFRAKAPQRMLDELERIVHRHQVLDICFADNILDMGYLQAFLPRLAERGWDLRIFFEIKSNLTYEQLCTLARAGVALVQPGIENLSTRVLELMRKGVSGWQNVRLLRDCATLGIFPGWNILYGFPGETADDYATSVSQMANLPHLTPPEGVNRVLLTRFSPFFKDPTLGLENRGPATPFRVLYRMPQQELADFVYMFESTPAGLGGPALGALQAAAAAWRDRHAGARLVALEVGGDLRIVDERDPGRARLTVLRQGPEVDAYRAALRGRSVEGLTRALRARGHASLAEAELRAMLGRWLEQGIVFHEDGHYVALATGLGYRDAESPGRRDEREPLRSLPVVQEQQA